MKEANSFKRMCRMSEADLCREFPELAGFLEVTQSFYILRARESPLGEHNLFCCTCPYFLDHANCKHGIAVAAHLKMPPFKRGFPQARVPIVVGSEMKCKRGARPKAHRAGADSEDELEFERDLALELTEQEHQELAKGSNAKKPKSSA